MRNGHVTEVRSGRDFDLGRFRGGLEGKWGGSGRSLKSLNGDLGDFCGDAFLGLICFRYGRAVY